MLPRPSIPSLLLATLLALACVGSPGPSDRGSGAARPPRAAEDRALRASAARTAESMLGAPYRYGGRSPRGFDGSGLVVYSFAKTGLAGLPHSAVGLRNASREIPLREIEPGDLLFFRLGGRKTSHVAIYVGGGAFVHAPSGGKRVERVSLDHVYWGPRLREAGRLAF